MPAARIMAILIGRRIVIIKFIKLASPKAKEALTGASCIAKNQGLCSYDSYSSLNIVTCQTKLKKLLASPGL